MVAGNRNAVEQRHLERGELDDVGHDSHTGRGRIDVGIANHELLENVVLHRPGKFGSRHALLLARYDESSQNGQHRPVHGHRDRHPLERNAAKEYLHVLHRIYSHARLAHVAQHSRVVRIETPVGGQVEGHAQPLLARCEVGPVKGIALLGGGKTGVLAHGPGPSGVHAGAGATHERLESRQGIGVLESVQIGPGVERLDRYALGGRALEPRCTRGFLPRQTLPALELIVFGIHAPSIRPLGFMQILSNRGL